MSVLLVLKFIHILAAITAVGSNISYTVWIIRAQRDPSHTAFALNGIRFLDNRVANPAYGVLLLTGLALVFVAGYSFLTLWIDVALVLFVVVVVLAAAFYTPTLRDQIKLVEAGDTTSAAFERLASRNQTFGIAIGVIVLLILVMMVFKPTL
ncbi:MAG: DUF2269 family protein [Chloroflexi bacterium]|nr:MAG: DUF2269 family protein [Chloroflexota bacterium]